MSYHKQEAYCTVQNPWSGFKDLGFLAVGLRPRLRFLGWVEFRVLRYRVLGFGYRVMGFRVLWFRCDSSWLPY